MASSEILNCCLVWASSHICLPPTVKLFTSSEWSYASNSASLFCLACSRSSSEVGSGSVHSTKPHDNSCSSLGIPLNIPFSILLVRDCPSVYHSCECFLFYSCVSIFLFHIGLCCRAAVISTAARLGHSSPQNRSYKQDTCSKVKSLLEMSLPNVSSVSGETATSISFEERSSKASLNNLL